MDPDFCACSECCLRTLGTSDVDDRPSRCIGGNRIVAVSVKSMRGHKSYIAFVGHRISGLVLALFLPIHFLVLGLALEGADTLNRFLVFTDLPLVKLAEWILVVLLSVHLLFGFRVLMLELTDWPNALDSRTGWIIPSVLGALIVGFIFLAQF